MRGKHRPESCHRSQLLWLFAGYLYSFLEASSYFYIVLRLENEDGALPKPDWAGRAAGGGEEGRGERVGERGDYARGEWRGEGTQRTFAH